MMINKNKKKIKFYWINNKIRYKNYSNFLSFQRIIEKTRIKLLIIRTITFIKK